MFTQYDKLYKQIKFDLAKSGKLKGKDDAQKADLIEKESKKFYRQHCEEPIEQLQARPKRLKKLWVSSVSSTCVVFLDA